MQINYYICRTSNFKNFTYGSKYIRVRDGHNEGYGIYLNRNHELEAVFDSNFVRDEVIMSVMDVYATYSCKSGAIKSGKMYGVYKIGSDGKYYVFTEKFTFEYLHQDWFISKKERNNFTENGFREIVNRRDSYCRELDTTEKNNDMISEKMKNEQEQQEKIKMIEKVSRAIAANTGVSVIKIISQMPKDTFWTLISLTGLGIVDSLALKSPLVFMLAIGIFITAMIGRKKEKKVIKNEIKVDLQNYERLNAMNKLSLTMLGKIQRLQNYMTIMRYRNVSEEIILLIEQSINLTVFTTIQDDYYNANREELDIKLSEFLDNTLEYVKTSLQNKDMEIYQIKKNLSEDYLKMIDDNSEMFKSITKDLKHLNVFKEDETKKKEEVPKEKNMEDNKETTE